MESTQFGCELTLPWPPTVNTYYRHINGRPIISKKGREYREAVLYQVLAQKAAIGLSGNLIVSIEAWRPDRRRRDLDNYFKAMLDAMTNAGVWQDDSQIVDLRIYWTPGDVLGGMMKVRITKGENNE